MRSVRTPDFQINLAVSDIISENVYFSGLACSYDTITEFRYWLILILKTRNVWNGRMSKYYQKIEKKTAIM